MSRSGAQIGPWTNLPLGANLATPHSAGFAPLSAAIDSFGVVHLRGTILASAIIANGVTMATLPAGMRPANTLMPTGNSANFGEPFTITAAGALVCGTNTIANAGYFSFDGITFVAGS